jgi:hypothetical protein
MKQVKQTPTRGKRKIILSTSKSESEEKLKRRPKQKKTEEKEKRVLEEEKARPVLMHKCSQEGTKEL